MGLCSSNFIRFTIFMVSFNIKFRSIGGRAHLRASLWMKDGISCISLFSE